MRRRMRLYLWLLALALALVWLGQRVRVVVVLRVGWLHLLVMWLFVGLVIYLLLDLILSRLRK